jgi:hypothetical protein
MGQYYKPCILGENKKTILSWVYSHDYESGLKLMEHSWFKNDFVGAIEKQFMKGGVYYKKRLAWAGDYADECKGLKSNLFDRCKDNKKMTPPAGVISEKYKFIVNHSKKQFVDKSKVKGNNDGWRIHPLPLLTAEGNGRGGGDFRGESELIGMWARDVISVEKETPENYKEIVFDLVER